jgi:hypothetical protein
MLFAVESVPAKLISLFFIRIIDADQNHKTAPLTGPHLSISGSNLKIPAFNLNNSHFKLLKTTKASSKSTNELGKNEKRWHKTHKSLSQKIRCIEKKDKQAILSIKQAPEKYDTALESLILWFLQGCSMFFGGCFENFEKLRDVFRGCQIILNGYLKFLGGGLPGRVIAIRKSISFVARGNPYKPTAHPPTRRYFTL